MTNTEKYIAHETRMQKFRILTPVGLVILGCVVTSGFGFVGWCGDSAVKALTGRFDTIERKQDILFEKIGTLGQTEADHIKCLNNNFSKCGACRGYDVC